MENISDVERLRLLIKQEIELGEKIEKLSIYEVEVIGEIIAKLMTRYEGVEYQLKKDSHYFYDSDYCVRTTTNELEVLPSCELGFISDMKFKHLHFDYSKKTICFLPPSGYLDIINSSFKKHYIYKDYIQKFIDYLYSIKSSENITSFSKERLEELLNEFLDNTKEEQEARKREIDKKTIEKKERDERYAFERLCMVDRNSIFNAICYIVNNYSDNMTALQNKYSEWSRTGQWSTLIVYHKLSIKSSLSCLKDASFTAEVDRDGSFPDEEEYAMVNYGKRTSINYFDLKNSLYSRLINNPCCVEFMQLIENRFQDTKVLMDTDVEELLAEVKLKNKEKVKKI